MNQLVGVNEKGYRIGQNHPGAKLTDHEVDLLRTMREQENLSYRKLAVVFGMSVSCVRRICRYQLRAQTPMRYVRSVEDPLT